MQTITACRQRLAEVEQSAVKNVDLSDPNQVIRDQQNLGTCVSFGLMGLVENNFFLETGISIDLSERYFIRSSLVETGRYAYLDATRLRIIDAYGLVPEVDFPYNEIIDRKAMLEASTIIESLDENDYFDQSQFLAKTLSELNTQSIDDRRRLLDRGDYLGPFPSGPQESEKFIGIPTLVKQILDQSRVRRVEGTPCFTTDVRTTGNAEKLMSPIEFATGCIGFSGKDYWSVLRSGKEKITDDDVNWIKSVLDRRSAVVFGMKVGRLRTAVYSVAPQLGYLETENMVSPEYLASVVRGGHAILVTGYISREDLAAVRSHEQGFLKGDGFERINLLYDVNLESIKEHIFGSIFPFSGSFPEKIREKDESLQRRRNDLKQKFYEQRSAIDQLRDDLDGYSANITSYRKRLIDYRGTLSELKALEREIINFRIQNLAPPEKVAYLSRSSAFKAAKKRVQNADRHAEAYPFEIIHDRGSDSYIASLRGFSSWPIKSIKAPSTYKSLEDRRAKRVESALGRLIANEGGIFIARNSWGQDATTSIEGYYYVTFDYFKKYGNAYVYREK